MSELTSEELREQRIQAALRQSDSKAAKFASGELKPTKDLEAQIAKTVAETERLKAAYGDDLLDGTLSADDYAFCMESRSYAYSYFDPGDGGPLLEIRVAKPGAEPVLSPYSRFSTEG